MKRFFGAYFPFPFLLSAPFLKFLFSQLWGGGSTGGFGSMVSGIAFECHM
jgi:hypothetical protein